MAKGDRFDLVFMDIQMPNLDGIQSTKLIREMGFSAPIVALTAFAEESNMKECMESGMDFFLPKPIRRPALKQVLKRFTTIPEEDGDGAVTNGINAKCGQNTDPASNASQARIPTTGNIGVDSVKPQKAIHTVHGNEGDPSNISPMS
jgi:osomolarity two-component system, sensor histidine kinase SLN1